MNFSIFSGFKYWRSKSRVNESHTINDHLQLSPDLANKLVNDSVKFKLYVTQYHLDILKQYKKRGLDPPSIQSRVHWEMEIECLLAQLIGSIDALLIQINRKLGLGLDEKSIYSNERVVNMMNEKLNAKGKGGLLADLQSAVASGEWLWTLRDLRIQGLHTNLLNMHFRRGITENVSLRIHPQTDLEIITYLEDNINRIKNLIYDVIKNETSLRT
jgi:hypothetical protein